MGRIMDFFKHKVLKTTFLGFLDVPTTDGNLSFEVDYFASLGFIQGYGVWCYFTDDAIIQWYILASVF